MPASGWLCDGGAATLRLHLALRLRFGAALSEVEAPVASRKSLRDYFSKGTDLPMHVAGDIAAGRSRQAASGGTLGRAARQNDGLLGTCVRRSDPRTLQRGCRDDACSC